MNEFYKCLKEEKVKYKITHRIIKRLNFNSSLTSFMLPSSTYIPNHKGDKQETIIQPSYTKNTIIAAAKATATGLATSTNTATSTSFPLLQTTFISSTITSTAVNETETSVNILNSAIKIIHQSFINQNEPEKPILHENYLDINNSWISSSSLLLLIVVYCIVVFGGVIGNTSLFITLCSQSSARLRNPILVALCLSDLLVAGISAPFTILTLALTQQSWTLPSIGCKTIYYLQSMPVAASTILFLMLSLDRYAAVKHPNLAQLRQRRYVHTILVIMSWIGACAICLPILLAYRIESVSTANSTLTISPTTSQILTSSQVLPSSGFMTRDMELLALATQKTKESMKTDTIISASSNSLKTYTTRCHSNYGSNQLQASFIIIHTILVFIFPGLGVALNHFGVRRKLCALSLTARAAHGELPLPMPILRRPTHMIIVTGMPNTAHGVCSDESSEELKSNGNNIIGRNNDKTVNEKNMVETIIRTSPKSPRVMREVRIHQRQKLQQDKTPAPELPLPQTSTLRSRRKLANILVLAAMLFIICWTPHVFCVLWAELSHHKQYCSKTISYISLLLGHMHSAINPIMYWILNHNTLRQSPCAPFLRFNALQRFLQRRLRSPVTQPPPSSTNEAALGAFNPRYIKNTPKQYRAQASSHYLY